MKTFLLSNSASSKVVVSEPNAIVPTDFDVYETIFTPTLPNGTTTVNTLDPAAYATYVSANGLVTVTADVYQAAYISLQTGSNALSSNSVLVGNGSVVAFRFSL